MTDPARPSATLDDIEETSDLRPRFDANGLIAAIVVDASDNKVLMFAYMNQEALDASLNTGFVHMWSRSRQKLWRKGETSGETLKIVSMHTDCDQDALLISAQPQGIGATCHTGRRSCFYRAIEPSTGALKRQNDERLFDPLQVYKK